jgi:two-component system, chemotaxis family, chemotaxis protein CheY
LARILVVDDAGFIRRWCTRALEEQGHEVVEATNGKEGVRAFDQMRPDAVLMDVSMPVMDGLTALQQIRVLDPAARVAMLTSEGHMETVVEARRLGARDFVVKPCDSARLLAAIDRILS